VERPSRSFFERQFSIDSSRRFKLAPEVYQIVVELLNVPPALLRTVATHVCTAASISGVADKGSSTNNSKCSDLNWWAKALLHLAGGIVPRDGHLQYL
jgi:hypothetical protein